MTSINLYANRFTEFPTPLASLSCYINLRNDNLRSLYGMPQVQYRNVGAILLHQVSDSRKLDQYDAIATYYAHPLIDIADSLIQEGNLTELETEHLLHEATPAIRQYLESDRPPTHPIIVALAEHWTVEITIDSNHHHFLL